MRILNWFFVLVLFLFHSVGFSEIKKMTANDFFKEDLSHKCQLICLIAPSDINNFTDPIFGKDWVMTPIAGNSLAQVKAGCTQYMKDIGSPESRAEVVVDEGFNADDYDHLQSLIHNSRMSVRLVYSVDIEGKLSGDHQPFAVMVDYSELGQQDSCE